MGDIVDLAIQIETNAESVYRSALKKISDPTWVSILQWLADEEVEHARWFRRLKETIQIEVKDPAVEAMGKSLLRDVLGRQSFSLRETDFGEISQLSDLLLLSIEFEKDKVLFYNMLRPFIEDEEMKGRTKRKITKSCYFSRWYPTGSPAFHSGFQSSLSLPGRPVW